MTTMRRCDREGCDALRVDDPPGVAGYTSIPLDGRTVDLCICCTNVFKNWLKGEGEFIPNKPVPESGFLPLVEMGPAYIVARQDTES